MARTYIHGGEQIQASTVPWSVMVGGAIVPIASIVSGSNIILSTGAVSMGASLDMGGNTVINSATPVNATDLVTKAYVDAKSGGIGGIHDVRVAAVSNQAALSGLLTIDGVTVASGDLVLCTAQTTATQNGPWVAASGAWARPSWWAAASTVNEGQYFMVAEGTAYKDTKFWCTTVGTITVNTTASAFSQDLSGQIYTASTGLSLGGGAFSVNYGTTAGTAAQGNDSRITGALQTSGLGTNVATALGIAVGSAGSVVVNGGNLGSPSSGTLSGCTGLPLAGVTGFGTNVATALGVAVGSAGSVVVNGGALGTPSGGTLSSCTGLPIAGITGLGAGVASALAVAIGSAAGIPVLSGGVLTAGDFPALTGDVTNTAGTLSTTVNNISGTGFTKYTNFVSNETPTGALNGSNTTFTLANTPATVSGSASSLELMLNGVTLDAGAGNDFTLSAATITMLFAPASTDKLRAYYMK